MSSQLTEEEIALKLGMDVALYSALKNSLYPGASDESVFMVNQYCKAAKLDPILKPVHLVPMYVQDKTKPKDSKGYYPSSYRDVVMPGIGLYRIQAHRTGEYAGMSAPKFGADIKEKVGSKEITYPEECTITIKRRSKDGFIAEWTVTQRWIENYATKGKDDATPNAMWLKRPYAQLAKCTVAQALREAFPELGSQPTAEEMEGKLFDYIEGEEKQKNNLAEDVENRLRNNRLAHKISEPISKTDNVNNQTETQSSEEILNNSNLEKSEPIEAGDECIISEALAHKIDSCKSIKELEPLLTEINNIKKFSDKKNLIGIYQEKIKTL